MRIKRSDVNRGWFTVHVDPNELVVGSGKRLPYGTTIGVVRPSGRIDVWSPAASKPRGYREAAKRMMEDARDELCRSGELTTKACKR